MGKTCLFQPSLVVWCNKHNPLTSKRATGTERCQSIIPRTSRLIQPEMARDRSPPASKSRDAVATYKAPSAYPPCIHAAKELNPIAISQMKMETHHRGERVIVRVLFPPIRDVGLITLVEDEEGTSTGLCLLFQPSETVVPAERTLRLGGCYLIKEPFFTTNSNGSDSLRVDHPSDIIMLPLDHELIPVEWKKGEISVGKSREMRMQGNNAVGNKKWAEAEDL